MLDFISFLVVTIFSESEKIKNKTIALLLCYLLMALFQKLYRYDAEQFLPISLDEAWDFFSSPHNLKEITPAHLDFKITNDTGKGKMYEGMFITYIVKPVLGIPMRWCTEITHIEDKKHFIDEQRFGPYSCWHHEHHFEAVDGGVLMKDTVIYGIPFGFIGRIANSLFVRKEVANIFIYRKEVTDKLFPTK